MPIHVTTTTVQSLSNKTFVDRLSTTNVVFASSGNSDNWSSVYSSVNSQSASNVSVFSTVNANSATNWNYQGTDIKSLTGNWQNTYSTVQSNSASWIQSNSLGTGVAAALSANIGTGGAVVVNGGALGTPSGGTLTNCSGLSLTTGVTGDLPLSSFAQASAASRLLGRGSASGAGDFQEITLGSGLSMSGTTLSATGGSGGKIAQVVYNEDATLVSTTAAFPQDNTTPQDNEGAAYTQLDTTITPTNSSSKLLIQAVINFNSSGLNSPTFGIFGPSSTNAIQVFTSTIAGTGYVSAAILIAQINAVNTNAQTYKVRFGSQTTSFTTRINPASGITFNSSIKSTLTITEILQ